MISFEKLDEENWQSLHNLALGMYLDGQCYEFAAALNQNLGWGLYGLMQGEVIRHAVCGDNEDFDVMHDVRGPLSVHEVELGKPFDISPPYELKRIVVDSLRNVRSVPDEAIERASLFAEALWPDLPWRSPSFQHQVSWFMSDLEKLCKKYGVYIRAPYPTAMPVICKAYGDEKGFKMCPTMDGQYFFDRVL